MSARTFPETTRGTTTARYSDWPDSLCRRMKCGASGPGSSRIESNWVKPADSREDLMWVVLLDVVPGNEVNDITFEQFNGTETERRSIETAIRRSSPLPAPPTPKLFERRLRLRYPAPE